MDGIRINNRLYAGTTPPDTIPASMIERTGTGGPMGAVAA